MSFNVVNSNSYNGMGIKTFDNYDEALKYFIQECKWQGLNNESSIRIMKNNKNIGYQYSFWGRKREFNLCIHPTPYNNDKEYEEKLEEIKTLINKK